MAAACSGSPDQPGATPPPGGEVPTAAPGDGSTTDPDGDGKVTITFAAWDYERQIYEQLAQKFMEENSGINVVIVPLDNLMNYSDPNADYSPLGQFRRVVSGADTAPASRPRPRPTAPTCCSTSSR